MKIFTCTQFRGHWPVGVAAVVVAPSIEDAIGMLAGALSEKGLQQDLDAAQFSEIDTSVPQALVLNDGNY